MKTHHLVNGLTFTFEKAKVKRQSQPILFIHGMWEGAWIWDKWMKYASREGFNSYAINLRGHHGSDPGCCLGKASINDYIYDCNQLIGHIKQQTGSYPYVVGHSMGGLIAQCIAKHRYASKAVFVTTAPPRGIFLDGLVIKRLIKNPMYLLKIFMKRSFMLEFTDALELEMNNLPFGVADDFYKRLVPESGMAARDIIFMEVDVSPGMPIPTMVVSGEKDQMTSPRIQQWVANRYGSKFCSYPNGHMIMLEPGLSAMVDILDFFQM